MVKNTVDAINGLLGQIRPISAQPTFKSLWQLSQELSLSLGKLTHPDRPDEGFAGYMMTAAAFVLHSCTPWINPMDVEKYFVIPAITITKTEQKSPE